MLRLGEKVVIVADAFEQNLPVGNMVSSSLMTGIRTMRSITCFECRR